MLKSQNTETKTNVHLKVTTCLYLIPIIRERSLSTLIAVTVSKETPPNITAKMLKIFKISFRALESSGDAKRATWRGCVMIPTQRSVLARQPKRSFDGG